jgi:hypothetical protein
LDIYKDLPHSRMTFLVHTSARPPRATFTLTIHTTAYFNSATIMIAVRGEVKVYIASS